VYILVECIIYLLVCINLVISQWECVAELDPQVKFGQLNVQCEGYDYPDDPNILRGSCGVSLAFVVNSAMSHYKTHNSRAIYPLFIVI